MTEDQNKLPLWPFFAADALLLGAAALIFFHAHRPLLWWEAVAITVCVASAAAGLILPFLRRFADESARSQARLLADAASQLQKVDQLAAHITAATSQWRECQEQAARSAAAAKALAQSMSAEALAFSEVLQKANDSEKNHLRLEVEKLRRAEGEWLHVLVPILDHVFGFFQAARRSGQPALAEQVTLFQNNCREAARRVGLVPTVAAAGEPFDPALHQLANDGSAHANALVADTLATGYTYQGQFLRRVLVALQDPNPPASAPEQ